MRKLFTVLCAEICVVLCLTACGQVGPLYLPKQHAPPKPASTRDPLVSPSTTGDISS